MTARLPNLFIAGYHKCGTTSLYTYLNAHPDFFGSSKKETGYFLPARFVESKVDLKKYANTFFAKAGDERFIFEATPNYANGKRRLATYFRETFPDVRIIMLLREPVDQLKSLFNFSKDQLAIPKEMTFGEFLDFRAHSGLLGPTGAPRHYIVTLPDWIDVFGDDLYVGFFEDLKRDAAGFTDDICRWLGVPPASESGVTFTVENASILPENVALHKIANRINMALEPLWRSNHGLKRAIRAAYHRINKSRESRPEPTPEEIAGLRAAYAERNALLAALLRERRPGLALPGWLAEVETGATAAG